ncbi:MAG: J domain-containing protein [Firmicutes bacterium]|nr:J domain-containing protein [Eubacterium sp.]MBR2558829.1 J domain-containing protein [Bacillota bacterium]MBR3053387.1 J domain-containing protein [Bacillota bacterium]
MDDPYKVLGLDRKATDEEIKAAYRELVKKYHPDKYRDNPLADLAQEKLMEINEAYDLLMRGKGSSVARKGSSGDAYTQYTNTSSRYSSYGSPEYDEIRVALDNGELAKAENLLINRRVRDAEWFFLSGVLSYKKGYRDDALMNVRQAISMDPENQEYKMVYTRMTGQQNVYRRNSNELGFPVGMDCMDCITCYCCSSLISPCW